METLFAPVIGLLNRLKYKAKFLVVLVIAGTVGVVTVGQIYQQLSDRIELTEIEQRGLASYPAAIKVLTLMQQHRGLTAGLLGGEEALAPKVDGKAQALQQAVAGFDQMLAGPAAGFGLDPAWSDVKGQWAALRNGGRALGQAENFARHTRMIEGMLKLIIGLGDTSNLSLDPEGASFNLFEPMLRSIPEATERLGRLRGQGTNILAKREIGRSDFNAMIAQLAELGLTANALDERVGRAARANASDAAVLEAARQDIATAIEGLRKTATEQIVEARFELPPAQFFALGTAAIDTILEHLNGVFAPTAERLLEARLERLKTVRLIEVGVAALALAVLGYILIGMYFAIVASVGELIAGAHQLAEGDYTTRVRFSARDELSEVSDQFNAMTESLGTLVSEIKTRAGELAEAASQLTASSQSIAGSSEQQSEAATGMAAAIEQMTVSIGEISRHAGDAAAKSESSGELAGEGSQLARRTVDGMEKLAEVVGRSATVIEQLGIQSSQISNIVSTIREIADQTNLLALNAAIEAARAGETGRGFAVVADEVRKLAERTATATGEIAGMVDAIQSGTREAVETMQQGVERVREGVELSSRSGEAMTHISDSASQVLIAVRDINHALGEQGSASTEIARNVEHIARMAEENSGSVKASSQTAVRLETVAAELLAQVSRFRV